MRNDYRVPPDLDAISSEWLQQCGPHDYGMDNAGCACAEGDYRPVMMHLVDEVKRMRSLVRTVEICGTGYLWRDPATGEHVLSPEDVLVFIRAGDQTEPERQHAEGYRKAIAVLRNVFTATFDQAADFLESRLSDTEGTKTDG